MCGLGPRIGVFMPRIEGVDGRDKHGHDAIGRSAIGRRC